MLDQPVQAPVEAVVVDLGRVEPEQVIERGGLEPLLGHAQFRGLTAETRDGQQLRDVSPSDRLAARGQELGQEFIQAQAVPQREREVTLAKLTAALHSQPRQIGLFPLRGRRRVGAERLEAR